MKLLPFLRDHNEFTISFKIWLWIHFLWIHFLLNSLSSSLWILLISRFNSLSISWLFMSQLSISWTDYELTIFLANSLWTRNLIRDMAMDWLSNNIYNINSLSLSPIHGELTNSFRFADFRDFTLIYNVFLVFFIN